MRAISLWQPWASLWLTSRKLHETRHWSIAYRGPLAVHAAKRFVKDIDGPLLEILQDEFGGHWAEDLPTGAVLGWVNLADCRRTEEIYPTPFRHDDASAPDDYWCGDFAEGRFGWRQDRAVILPRPVPYVGRQGLFHVPDELLVRV